MPGIDGDHRVGAGAVGGGAASVIPEPLLPPWPPLPPDRRCRRGPAATAAALPPLPPALPPVAALPPLPPEPPAPPPGWGPRARPTRPATDPPALPAPRTHPGATAATRLAAGPSKRQGQEQRAASRGRFGITHGPGSSGRMPAPDSFRRKNPPSDAVRRRRLRRDPDAWPARGPHLFRATSEGGKGHAILVTGATASSGRAWCPGCWQPDTRSRRRSGRWRRERGAPRAPASAR